MKSDGTVEPLGEKRDKKIAQARTAIAKYYR